MNHGSTLGLMRVAGCLLGGISCRAWLNKSHDEHQGLRSLREEKCPMCRASAATDLALNLKPLTRNRVDLGTFLESSGYGSNN